ncbi:MAG TPA: hypothetical protein VIV40_38455 [Kofleriaceae bacterium]
MHRLAWLPLLLAAACGTTTDDRPLELDYLTQAIFAPTCGATQCHSSFTQARNVVLDTPEAVRSSLLDNGLIRFDSTSYDPDSPNQADLITWITDTDPFGLGIGRMPYDAPMPNKDVLLLKEWIAAQAPGAQCNPDVGGGMACNNKEVVQCNADWTFGTRVQLCSGDCVQGTCR